MKNAVKVVAAADLHGIASSDRLLAYAVRHRADIIVIAGDVQTAVLGVDPRMHFENSFLPMVRKAQDYCMEVVLVPGNHDTYIRDALGADRRKRWYGNLHVLVDKRETICGLDFYGTPWVPYINGIWAYEEDDVDLAKRFANIPRGIDFLVAHTPPFGIDSHGEHWDVSLGSTRCGGCFRHFGSSALRAAVELTQPKFLVCGHIHTGDHDPGVIGKTTVLNVSLLSEGYTESYSPAEIVVFPEGDGSKRNMVRTNGGKRWKKL